MSGTAHNNPYFYYTQLRHGGPWECEVGAVGKSGTAEAEAGWAIPAERCRHFNYTLDGSRQWRRAGGQGSEASVAREHRVTGPSR